MDYNLIVPFIPNLRRYAGALTMNPGDAEDLVQETLERAVRKFHLWRPGDLRAWLFSIMHNVFVNNLKRRRHQTVDIDDVQIAARVASADGLDMMDLRKALGALPAEQREVLLLIGLEDMSYVEVSQSLGIPIGTVMSRLSRGRQRLRREMDGEATIASRRIGSCPAPNA